MAWYIKQAPMSGALAYLHEFLMYEFERIFGKETMHAYDCTIYNDPESVGPYCQYSEHVLIRLQQQSLDYWAQTVFQLSHEMTHYALLVARQRARGWVCWYDEILCEAMSLYALEYAANNWKNCWLSRINPGFDRSMQEYLQTNMNDRWDDALASCRTPEALLAYERAGNPEKRRSGHVRERNRLYQAIRRDPLATAALLYYRGFLRPNGVVINFDAWRRANPTNPLIPVLAQIQPVK